MHLSLTVVSCVVDINVPMFFGSEQRALPETQTQSLVQTVQLTTCFYAHKVYEVVLCFEDLIK